MTYTTQLNPKLIALASAGAATLGLTLDAALLRPRLGVSPSGAPASPPAAPAAHPSAAAPAEIPTPVTSTEELYNLSK